MATLVFVHYSKQNTCMCSLYQEWKIYTITDVHKKASNHCIETLLCISSHATGISQQNWSNPEENWGPSGQNYNILKEKIER